ncbi:hypothetical protein VTN77DRAFT_1487 [Rasamsonia byssochlamydoides]|uniref:uncharacterized protein n=1 Tax=Rasamsonia byssochlamydoides TaxID=89139 RepID=UPI00374395DA
MPSLPVPVPRLKPIKSTNQFVLRYSPQCGMTPIAARFVQSETHPLRPKILHMYANRDRNTLWWRVSVNHLPLKRVVRSWCARRARTAFKQALEERGFDPEGRPLKKEEPSSQTVGLKGTVEIVVNQRSIKEELPAVKEEMASLVDSLVRAAQNQGHSSGNKPPEKREKSKPKRRAPDEKF